MAADDDPRAPEAGLDEIDPATAVKGGQGPLMANGSELVIKGSKPLPSSD
jgi:hypothetical protein